MPEARKTKKTSKVKKEAPKKTEAKVKIVKKPEVVKVAEKKPAKKEYYYGKGGRKTTRAQARIYPNGKGEILINEKDYKIYFPYFEFQKIITEPLRIVNEEGKVKITVKVSGGGKRGQAEGVRHAISRALIELNPDYRKILKPYGFLTRDARMKERKKFGLKRARKAPQWAKR